MRFVTTVFVYPSASLLLFPICHNQYRLFQWCSYTSAKVGDIELDYDGEIGITLSMLS